MPVFRLQLPGFIQVYVDKHYLDVSLSRVLPFVALLVFGFLIGFVYRAGFDHPYDKVIHMVFFGLLTISIHTLFCCRLRISAVVAFMAGIGGELIQAFIPHRMMSIPDTFANGIGVALVVVAIALIRAENRQAVKDEQEDFSLDDVGFDPVQIRYISGASSSLEK